MYIYIYINPTIYLESAKLLSKCVTLLYTLNIYINIWRAKLVEIYKTSTKLLQKWLRNTLQYKHGIE